jgi:hypothetical protein
MYTIYNCGLFFHFYHDINQNLASPSLLLSARYLSPICHCLMPTTAATTDYRTHIVACLIGVWARSSPLAAVTGSGFLSLRSERRRRSRDHCGHCNSTHPPPAAATAVSPRRNQSSVVCVSQHHVCTWFRSSVQRDTIVNAGDFTQKWSLHLREFCHHA